jgi:PAS domain-containing protein
MDKAPGDGRRTRLNMNNFMRESVEIKNGVTELLGADVAPRWNEERYRTLFDLGPVAVYSCDALV